jgi:hypothetical protein
VHPATVRRLLVFGVCAAGVGCLYLVPGIARAPQPVDGPRPRTEPAAVPSVTAVATTSTSSSPEPRARTVGPEPAATTEAPRDPVQTTAARSTTARRPANPDATPFDPARDDAVAPAPVGEVTSAALTPDRLTLRWPAASDNVGVVRYRVLLNGFEVASTPATHATVRWFNDDAREHVVQVRALDAAGNESPASPSLLVSRPTPSPSPSPTPAPSTEPDPSVSPSPEPEPSASATEPSGEIPENSTPDEAQEPTMTPSPQPLPSAGVR